MLAEILSKRSNTVPQIAQHTPKATKRIEEIATAFTLLNENISITKATIISRMEMAEEMAAAKSTK